MLLVVLSIVSFQPYMVAFQ